MPTRRSTILAALTIPLPAGPVWAQTSLERQVDAQVAPLVAGQRFAGVALAARGDQVLLEKGYGLASVELGVAHTPASRMQLASTSKPITAAAVLKLAEQGRIDLNSPISRLLPDYPGGDRITPHHLLTHTAGAPNVNSMPIYAELGLKRRTTAEVVDAFKAAPPDFAPGEAYVYSNSNFVLLALLVERASGLSYGDYLQQQVFAPLGMTASGHRGDARAVIPNLAEGYEVGADGRLTRPAWFDWTVKTGNGSLYATVGDLHRFVRGYFSGRLFGQQMVQLATSPKPVPAPPPGFDWMPRQTGYGWFIETHLGRKRVIHAGRSPGYSAFLAYYPDEAVTVAVLSNRYVDAAQPIADATAGMVLGSR